MLHFVTCRKKAYSQCLNPSDCMWLSICSKSICWKVFCSSLHGLCSMPTISWLHCVNLLLVSLFHYIGLFVCLPVPPCIDSCSFMVSLRVEYYWFTSFFFSVLCCLVKALVFPVVMYECESWTLKKAEHWRNDAFELWCWRRLLGVPWTARRSTSSS